MTFHESQRPDFSQRKLNSDMTFPTEKVRTLRCMTFWHIQIGKYLKYALSARFCRQILFLLNFLVENWRKDVKKQVAPKIYHRTSKILAEKSLNFGRKPDTVWNFTGD
jgi:hypothetical protein